MIQKSRKIERWPPHIPVLPRLTTYVDWFVSVSSDADPVFSFVLLFDVQPGGVFLMKQRERDAYEAAEKFLAIDSSQSALHFFQQFGPYRVSEGESSDQWRRIEQVMETDHAQASELLYAHNKLLTDLTADPIRLGEFYAKARPISFSTIQATIAYYRDAIANWPRYRKTYKKLCAKIDCLHRLPPEQRCKVKVDKIFTDNPRLEVNAYLGQNLPLQLVFETQQAIALCQDIESALRATVFLDNLGIDDLSRKPWRFCARKDCGKIFRLKQSGKQKFCSDECTHLQAVRNYNIRKRAAGADEMKNRDRSE